MKLSDVYRFGVWYSTNKMIAKDNSVFDDLFFEIFRNINEICWLSTSMNDKAKSSNIKKKEELVTTSQLYVWLWIRE